ncbi:MAG: tetratricopeptide repeat protein [Pirellulales bacterium]
MKACSWCACAAAAGLWCALGSAAIAQNQPAKGASKEPQRAAGAKIPPSRSDEGRQSSEAAIVQYRAAVAFHNRQQYDFAVEEWERFLAKFPDDPLAAKAQHYAGVCYLQLKKTDQAVAAFERAIAKYADFELRDAAYLNLGMAYYAAAQAGKPDLHDQAAATFAALVSKFPQSEQVPQALFFRGEALYARNNKKEAVTSYRELIEKHTKDQQRPQALYALGVTLQELNRDAEAGAAYDRFMRDYPKHALATEVMMREADTLLAAKEYARAEKQFATVARTPRFAMADYATLRQALALYEQKKYAEAANVYAALVKAFPKSQYVAAATLSAGNCFYLANMQKEARTWLGQVVAAGGEDAFEAAHWMARSFLKDNQPAEALKTVGQVLPRAGKSPQLALLKTDQADALYEIPQRRIEAVAVYADVARSHPESPTAPQAGYMAAYAALQVRDFKAARQYAEAFLKSHQGHSLTADVQFVLAESLIQLDEPAAAGTLYAELLDRHPDHADAEQWRVRRALALSFDQKHEAVVEYLRPIVAKLRRPDLMAEAQFLLGGSLFELKRYAEAREAFETSIKAQPKWRQADEALLGLSRTQRALGDVPAAKAAIQRLMAEFPTSNVLDRAHFRLGEYHFAAGEYQEAAREHAWVIEKTPQSPLAPHALYGLGWSQLNDQKADAAAKVFSRLIGEFKDHPLAAKALSGRASARLQTKDYTGATADVSAFLRGEKDVGETADALFILGLAQVGEKKHDAAIKTFQSIVKDYPQYSGSDKVLFELAWAHKSKGNEAEAVGHFVRLAERHSDSPLAAESSYHVGEHFYHQKKDYVQAAKAYQAALKDGGKSELGEKARHKLAWARYQQGEFAAAEKAFAQQLADYPRGALAADAAYMNAESLFKQENYESAYAAFVRAFAMKPSSEEFVTLGFLHAGQSAAQLKKWDESLRHLQELTAKRPQSPHVPEALYEQGWAKQNQRKFAEALKLYEAAAEKAPAREVGARARFMAGEVHFEQGNHKDAVRNFFQVAYGFSETGAPEAIRAWQASALYESGRCFEVLKNVDQAKKLYAELLEKYPSSDKADLAKRRLAELEKTG